jgi:predicted  nucleic acid-binding Zn-ribbon protein
MKMAAAFLLLASSAAVANAAADQVNPVGKVLELITGLQAKVISEGEKSQKVYEEFSEWCEERNKNLAYDIKTGKADVVELKATISEEAAIIESLTTKAEDLAQQIATDEADLKAATFIREKESAAFAAEKYELDDIIDTLQRAIQILEKHASAALLQSKGTANMVKALSSMVQASGFSSADADRLTALVQQNQDQEDDDAPDGAPAAAVYKGHSGGILEVLEDLLAKAEDQLKMAQTKETANLFNFQKLKQAIEDEISYGQKELAEAKAGIAAAGEKKATAEGDLAITSKDLKEDTTTLNDLHENCMTTAQTFEAEVKSRAEELKALATAKKVIVENVSGAEDLSYGFLQISSGVELAHFEAVRFVRDLAKRTRAPALTQLANRMATAMRMGGENKEDIFGKVKDLIREMIASLEAEGDADAKHHAYCTKELAYADQKKADRVAEIEKLTTSIDQMSARSAQLKEEVAQLEKELADIAASQAEIDKIRAEEHDTFLQNKADMEQGIEGVRAALKVLTEYYASDKEHVAAQGAGEGIIGLLEVVESDFQKGLMDMTASEESSQAEYEKTTKENEIATATKQQDVKYKTKESKDLDKATAEATSDREAVQTELEAVEKYLAKLHDECDETAPTYEELVARRSAEIAGLKQALQILEGEAALLQGLSKHATLRGVRKHIA